MILHGRYLSPYVRRVAVWAGLQGRKVDHRPIMVTGDDFERLRQVNPVGRVPVVETDEGETLIETWAIVDWLEDTAPSWGKRLLPKAGPERREVLQVIAYANSLAEKTVDLVYNRQRRPEQYHWPEWQDRLETQIKGALDWLEAKVPAEGFFGGKRPKGADVAVVCSFDFLETMHPQLANHPKLKALSKRANRRKVFGDCHPSTVTD